MSFNVILQFILQTVLISGLWIMMEPVITAVAYNNPIYEDANAQGKAIIDAFWSIGTALAGIAMGGNIIWFLQTLRKQQAVAE